jgi:hypothetical protein
MTTGAGSNPAGPTIIPRNFAGPNLRVGELWRVKDIQVWAGDRAKAPPAAATGKAPTVSATSAPQARHRRLRRPNRRCSAIFSPLLGLRQQRAEPNNASTPVGNDLAILSEINQHFRSSSLAAVVAEPAVTARSLCACVLASSFAVPDRYRSGATPASNQDTWWCPI